MIRLERRTEIIELNFTQACQILAAGLPGAVLRSHRLLPGGRANTNYLLETDDGACVLRMYVRDATTREKETALANMLAELPVPRVLGVGDVDAFPPFALFEFRRGRPLAEWLTESALPESAARNIGRLLAQTSKYSFERFGDLRVVDDGLCAVAWEVGENALLGFMRWCLFESPAGERLGPRARDRLWEITQREAEHDDGLPPTLSHGDFNPTNILLDETGTVTALLDWEFAHAGGPLSDIGNLLRVRDERDRLGALSPHAVGERRRADREGAPELRDHEQQVGHEAAPPGGRQGAGPPLPLDLVHAPRSRVGSCPVTWRRITRRRVDA